MFPQSASVTVADLMAESGVAFGTSGARGLVSAMTDRICHGYTSGFLEYLIEQGAWQVPGRVALAGDLRPSTPRILAACATAVRELGGEPVFCGFVPTPALAHWSFAENIPAVMVTGSHIPDDRNGIKFYRPDGEILKSDEPGIVRQIVNAPIGTFSAEGTLTNPVALPPPLDISASYIERYVRHFGPQALAGRRIGVYQHSAVGRDILTAVLSALGAEVLPLGRSERFVPVDTEAIRPEDIALAEGWARQHGLYAIASTDGDSDRPMLTDERGEWLRGDVLAMLCARAIGAQSVTTPVSSSSLVERIGAFAKVHRCRIGSPFVIAEMQAAMQRHEGLVCGYEANGGFLLAASVGQGDNALTALPTRDAVLPIVAVLVDAGTGGVRELLDRLPLRFTFSGRVAPFAPNRRDALMVWLQAITPGRDHPAIRLFAASAEAELENVDWTDGCRMSFVNGRIIHLRGSGNAPELRCYTEAESVAIAQQMSATALDKVIGQFPA